LKTERELFPEKKEGELVEEPGEVDDKEHHHGGEKESKEEHHPVTAATVVPHAVKPTGTAVIQILAGRNLVSRDSNGLSDPYCIVSFVDHQGSVVGKQTKKTKVKSKTLNPKWEETIELSIETAASYLEVSIMDEDKVGKDESMGRVLLPLSQLNQPDEKWHTVNPKDESETVSGEISLKIAIKN